MLPLNIIQQMINCGALIEAKETDKSVSFAINYRIIADEFPQFLEQLIFSNLNDVEKSMYLEGYMGYTITNSGDLIWKPTIKGRDFSGR